MILLSISSQSLRLSFPKSCSHCNTASSLPGVLPCCNISALVLCKFSINTTNKQHNRQEVSGSQTAVVRWKTEHWNVHVPLLPAVSSFKSCGNLLRSIWKLMSLGNLIWSSFLFLQCYNRQTEKLFFHFSCVPIPFYKLHLSRFWVHAIFYLNLLDYGVILMNYCILSHSALQKEEEKK